MLALQIGAYFCYKTTYMSEPSIQRQAVRAILKSDYKELYCLVESIELSSINTGRSPLLSYCTNRKIAQFLIDKGADLETKDARGETPLFKCWYKAKVARTLVALGADVNTSCYNGETVLRKGPSKDHNPLALDIRYLTSYAHL
jgi:ankyrin repeat protein